MTEDHALYALEDVLGGHCAVSNFAVRALIDIATRPVVQEEIRKELKEVLPDGDFGLGDKTNLKYLNATFFETVRTTCSAIVPHVANRNTTIAGRINQSIYSSIFYTPDILFCSLVCIILLCIYSMIRRKISFIVSWRV